MAGVRRKPNPGGKYQGWYTDAAGKRKFFTGTQDKKETLQVARGIEDDHRQIRLGYREAPTSAQKNRTRAFDEVVTEYLEWGAARGGWRGGPWSPVHTENRRVTLRWWIDRLGLETLADLENVLPRVEKALRGLGSEGRTGKTQSNYAEALRAFCNYCVDRGYLANDPLKALAPFDTTPQSQRRAMTPDDIRKLLAVSPPHRRLLYETALFSGLRANELRNLTVDHLDEDRGGVHLDAAWTKNRKPGFQPLPRSLVEQLQAFAGTGEAEHRRRYPSMSCGCRGSSSQRRSKGANRLARCKAVSTSQTRPASIISWTRGPSASRAAATSSTSSSGCRPNGPQPNFTARQPCSRKDPATAATCSGVSGQ